MCSKQKTDLKLIGQTFFSFFRLRETQRKTWREKLSTHKTFSNSKNIFEDLGKEKDKIAWNLEIRDFLVCFGEIFLNFFWKVAAKRLLFFSCLNDFLKESFGFAEKTAF